MERIDGVLKIPGEHYYETHKLEKLIEHNHYELPPKKRWLSPQNFFIFIKKNRPRIRYSGGGGSGTRLFLKSPVLVNRLPPITVFHRILPLIEMIKYNIILVFLPGLFIVGDY